jgi:hypothetical protein
MRTLGMAVLVLGTLGGQAAGQESVRLFTPVPSSNLGQLGQKLAADKSASWTPAPADIRGEVREAGAASLLLGTDARWQKTASTPPEDHSEARWQVAAKTPSASVATAAPTPLSERAWQVVPQGVTATPSH